MGWNRDGSAIEREGTRRNAKESEGKRRDTKGNKGKYDRKSNITWIWPAPKTQQDNVDKNSSDSESEYEDQLDTEPENSSPREPWTVYKYKRVDQKVHPVSMIMPEEMKSQCQFPNDFLKNLPQLPHHPPKFIPTEKVTEVRMASLATRRKENTSVYHPPQWA